MNLKALIENTLSTDPEVQALLPPGSTLQDFLNTPEDMDKLAANRHDHSLAVGAQAPSLLAGPIVDADGNRMMARRAARRDEKLRPGN